MKKIVFISGVLTFATAFSAPVDFAEPEPIPPVKELSYSADREVRLDAGQTITVACGDSSAAEWTREHLKLWYGFTPKVVGCTTTTPTGAEGYRLSAKPGEVRIEAETLQGVRYALFTLRQIAERDSVGETTGGFRLPALEITDSPALAFRGLHLCWFPEQSAALIEREIRVAAFLKFNAVVLEPWGVYRSTRHPWFGPADAPMTPEAIRRLSSVAKDLGVTLIPQLNVFGHASAARSCTGKHATLDLHPDRQPLFEPGASDREDMGAAWNWCLSNPDAVRTVRELVAEIHEAFGNPPYFHIGCDEADKPTCASCRAAPYARLVADHITAICDLLKERGARTMIWHDMLLRKGDPRWAGFYANGSAETAALIETLPKDVIICEWFYSGKTVAYPTLDFFAKTCGFDTLTCPWEDADGIRAQTGYARSTGLFGVLETTWHHFGGVRFTRMLQTAACGAWGDGERLNRGRFATAWRWCGWDMGSTDYSETGWYGTQSTRDILDR